MWLCVCAGDEKGEIFSSSVRLTDQSTDSLNVMNQIYSYKKDGRKREHKMKATQQADDNFIFRATQKQEMGMTEADRTTTQIYTLSNARLVFAGVSRGLVQTAGVRS